MVPVWLQILFGSILAINTILVLIATVSFRAGRQLGDHAALEQRVEAVKAEISHLHKKASDIGDQMQGALGRTLEMFVTRREWDTVRGDITDLRQRMAAVELAVRKATE